MSKKKLQCNSYFFKYAFYCISYGKHDFVNYEKKLFCKFHFWTFLKMSTFENFVPLFFRRKNPKNVKFWYLLHSTA